MLRDIQEKKYIKAKCLSNSTPFSEENYFPLDQHSRFANQEVNDVRSKTSILHRKNFNWESIVHINTHLPLKSES